MKALSLVLGLLLSFSSLASQQWRTPKDKELVYLQLETGWVVFELAPFMAAKHSQRFKDLIQEGFYQGLDFYRVIDGFVAQAGDESGDKISHFKTNLAAELSRPRTATSDFFMVQKPAFLAEETGFIQGFPAGRNSKREWLLHCPGTLAMARDTTLNSATTEFYVTLGQAPRHLDLNMSVFGRVLWGMQHLQTLNRADTSQTSGVIQDPNKRSKILALYTGDQVPKKFKLPLQVQLSNSAGFKQRLLNARRLSNDFYHYKGTGKLDVCYYGVKSRLKPKQHGQ